MASQDVYWPEPACIGHIGTTLYGSHVPWQQPTLRNGRNIGPDTSRQDPYVWNSLTYYSTPCYHTVGRNASLSVLLFLPCS